MHTNRRQFLKLAGTAAAVGCATPAPKTRRADGPPLPGSDSDNPDVAVDTGWPEDSGDLPDQEDAPVLADPGYGLPDAIPGSLTTSSHGDEDMFLSVLSGELPEDIEGHIWLVHPMPPGEGHPVFAGAGRIVRLDLGPDGFNASLRVARTPCYYADLATVGSGDGYNTIEMIRSSLTLGARNLANTAFVTLEDDRVFVTYDGGKPYEIDPAENQLATSVGWNSEWVGAMPGWMDWLMPHPFPMIMSTAHPAADGDTLFTVEYNLEILGNAPWTRVLRWNGRGALESWAVKDQYGQDVAIEQSVHQMVVSDDFVVIVDTAFVVELEALLGDSTMRAQSPETVIWVIRRDDMRSSVESVTATRVQVPLEVTHLSCDPANPGGEITLHLGHTPASDASEFLEFGDITYDGRTVRNDLVGLPASPSDLGAVGLLRINGYTGQVLEHTVMRDERLWGGPALCASPPADADGRIRTQYWASLGISPELRLSRIEAAYADHPYRHIALSDLPEEAYPSTLVKVDTTGPEVIDSWAFPPGRMCLSPQWVPGGTEGYMVTTMVSDDRDTEGSSGCEVWVFDCANLAQGPIARLGNTALNFPFTLHTAYTRTADARSASYMVDVRADTSAAVNRQNDTIKNLFETSIYPHFE